MSNQLRREVWNFYIVQPGDTLSLIFKKLYGLSALEVVAYRSLIAVNNSHIRNLDQIRSGQILDVRLSCSEVPLNHASDLKELETTYSSLSVAEKSLLSERPELVSTVQEWLAPLSVNIPDAGFNTIQNLVRSYAGTVERYGSELARSYAANSRGTMRTELLNKVFNKQPVQDAFAKIPAFVKTRLFDRRSKFTTPFNFKEAALRKDVRGVLRISPRSISTFNPFSTALRDYARVIRLAKYAGVVTTWVIPTAIGIKDSYDAYGTDEFGVTVARSTGNVLGGAAGTVAGYAACNLILGGPTFGTSLFWCGIGVGAGLGIVGGSVGGDLGGGLYGIYESAMHGQVTTMYHPEWYMQTMPMQIPPTIRTYR